MKILLSIISLTTLLFVTACSDDDKSASILGSWKGTKAEADILVFGIPTPLNETDDTFDAEVEFKENGTVTLTDDGQSSTGTWSQDGDKLIISITFSTDFIDLSGTYTIKQLTETNLKIYLEKDGAFDDPDSGLKINGTVKATLSFTKK